MTRIPQRLRQQIEKLAGGYCEYCKAPGWIFEDTMEVDHIRPRSIAGKTELVNLCYACRRCNNNKSAYQTGIDPVTNLETTLFNPRQHRWSEHFQWSSDFLQITGLTAIGRASIMRLELNRKTALRARVDWLKANWRPPTD